MNADVVPQGRPVPATVPAPAGNNAIHLCTVTAKPGAILPLNRPAYACACGDKVAGTRVELGGRWTDPRLCPTCIATYQVTERHTLDEPLDCLLIAVQED